MTRFVELGYGIYVNPAQVAMLRADSRVHTAVVFATGGTEIVAHPIAEVLAVLAALTAEGESS